MTRFNNTKYICFTLNNYTLPEVDFIKLNDELTYVCFGYETGSEGTDHLQGYAETDKQRSLTWWKKNISTRAHIEQRRGTQDEAIQYCKKDTTEANDNFFERGEKYKTKQGKRNDLVLVRNMIKDGKNMLDVLNEATSFQSVRIAEKLFQYEQIDPRVWYEKKIYWFYGPTGTGKSRRAHKEAADADDENKGGFWKMPVKKEVAYFTGYYGQRNVIFDEYRPSRMPMDHLLQLTDGYQCYVDIKNSGAIWKADHIWITANKKPEDMFAFEGRQHEKIDQLLRRITKVVNFETQEIVDEMFNTNE